MKTVLSILLVLSGFSAILFSFATIFIYINEGIGWSGWYLPPIFAGSCFFIAYLIFIFFKKREWEDDFLYLYISTRSKRSSKRVEESKEKMRQELGSDK